MNLQPRTDSWGDRNKRALGGGIVLAVGVLLGGIELFHLREMSSTIAMAVFSVLPFLTDLVLIGVGIRLLGSQFDGDETLRIAGWVLLGMAVLGSLVVWTITHQHSRGRPFSHAQFVTVNNLSVGGVVGFSVGWHDALRRRYRRDAETERARLEFLHSALRHNVFNGLNIILGYADLLEDRTEADGRDYLETIRNRGEELVRFTEATNALLANFLDRSVGTVRPLHLSSVLEREVASARAEFEHAAFSLTVPDDVYVEADELFAELVANLLSNAVLHNDKPTPRVSITARRGDDCVRIGVADNGPGIPDEQKTRMLEWNVSGPGSPGTGLGLAIADTLADRYGGTLWIADNEPTGTVLNLELPAADHRDGPEGTDCHPRPTASPAPGANLSEPEKGRYTE